MFSMKKRPPNNDEHRVFSSCRTAIILLIWMQGYRLHINQYRY
jgi:hypothetical protein